ncbi:zinc finger CCCH domain-containing protein 13 [Prunus yedoensis var. nudiflora]|uniref:Zinc finger CCCH domain-containing protein 13 n=1 Tax=Prunus yedoensis var. nudiflora TaxID=2094558 RepID=A0A314UUB6_PRUYE|nr:zinc finger CCCH domain-containing protein 13 [Prunus yedoensis var. nudiflora]
MFIVAHWLCANTAIVSGKNEVSSVVYKVGECMQELIKLWKEYEVSQGEKNESSLTGPTLEIRIPAEHVTATNRQVRGGQLWGTDIYTDDSDLVAVLMHTGYCRPTASPPPPAIQELRATVRVLPPQDCYISTLRNNVRSRAWGAAIGCSYRVERCCIVKKAGGTIDLEPCLTHTSTVEPTLAPVIVERTMTTRAAASNALRQQRFVREVTIQYNLCNEPWIKYSISIVADKGLKKTLYTSARLKKGEVLYLETHSRRYELCFTGEKMVKATQLSQMHEGETEKSQNHVSHSTNGEKNDSDHIMIDVFRWSRCKTPLPQKVTRSVGIPLPLEYVEVLEENLDWEDVQWSQTGVWIAGKEYTLARVHFLSTN